MNRIYSLYMHVFPNGKRYIGITKDVKARWRAGGYYYKKQPKMWRAICKYGWDSIKHIVLKSDMTQGEAENAEKVLIATLGTIENGYNTAIGGKGLNGSYLSPYLSEMVNAGRKLGFPLAMVVYRERKQSTKAQFWNEVEEAVTKKHGVKSSTDEWRVAEFWFSMGRWCDLNERIARGEDVSKWEEGYLELYIEKAIYERSEACASIRT